MAINNTANAPYSMAFKMRKTADEPKGDSSMSIEPADPKSGPVVDESKPAPHSESLVGPHRPGEARADSISPEPKAGPGWRKAVKPAPAHPGDIKRPGADDVVKT